MKHKALVLFLALLLVSPSLNAQEVERSVEIGFDIQHRLQHGTEKPTFTLLSPVPLTDVEVSLKRPGASPIVKTFTELRPNERRPIEITQPIGTFPYEASIRGTDDQGHTLNFTINFEVITIPPLELEVLSSGLDLANGQLSVHVNRPTDRIEIEVADEEGHRKVNRIQNFGGKQGTLALQWPAQPSTGSVRLTVHDIDGYWTSIVLEPFWIEIPHQTINFDTGLATWNKETEEPKLRETLARLRQVMAQQGSSPLDMRLYIAGYTDTVGSAESNRTLSTNRARAIARWFQRNGIEIPIYYQGFGEDALAVPTEDNVDEPQNRRALYILGNAPPPVSYHIPRSDWQRL